MIDAAVIGPAAIVPLQDGCEHVGLQPYRLPESVRGVVTSAVMVAPDALTLRQMLARNASGELAARVHSRIPLADTARAYIQAAGPGLRGRVVLVP